MKFKTSIILASGSPRRKSLLNELGIEFVIKLKDVDENYPDELKREEVAIYLARKKAAVYNEEVQEGFTVITADTIVCLDNQILGKPTDEKDAFRMLRLLSGKKHEVITAVCIKSKNEESCFHVTTADISNRFQMMKSTITSQLPSHLTRQVDTASRNLDRFGCN